jgi:predicted RecA/RadA family phage recombinase
MAAAAILKVEQGWAGDRVRNRVILTSASATTDTVTPAKVGLKQITAVVPTGRSGSIDGITVIAAGAADYVNSSGVIIVYIPTSTSAVSSGNYEFDFYGK